MEPSIFNQKEDEAFCGLLLAKHKVKVWDYIRVITRLGLLLRPLSLYDTQYIIGFNLLLMCE